MLMAFGLVVSMAPPVFASSTTCHPFGDPGVWGYSSDYTSGANREYNTTAIKSAYVPIWGGNQYWRLEGVGVDPNAGGGYAYWYPTVPRWQLLSNRTHTFVFIWYVTSWLGPVNDDCVVYR